MKTYTQHTSKADKKHINQAAQFKKPLDAKKNNWQLIGSGKYKTVYKKGKVVIKFSKKNGQDHIQAEVNKYFKLPKHYRKYLARIFGYDKDKMIQRYFPIKTKPKYTEKEFARFDVLTSKLKIYDVSLFHNVTIINNKPIIFDFGCCE